LELSALFKLIKELVAEQFTGSLKINVHKGGISDKVEKTEKITRT